MKKKEKTTSEKAESSLQSYFGEGKLFEAFERKILRLRNLLDIAKIINSSLDKKALLQSILYSCLGQFGILNASIFLTDATNDSIYNLVTSVGLDYESLNISFPETNPLIILLKTGIPYINVKNQLEEKKYKHFHKYNKILKGSVIIPLKAKKKLNGFLVLGEKLDGSDFGREDLLYISIFAELTSISVENITLYELVTLNRMTNLYNHHYFHIRLTEEINRAKRYNHALTIIMADIDHFKRVNDTYGHQEGDAVLISFADLLKTMIRKTDIVARYGGEEFAIILTESDIEKGQIVAEKIRKSIEKKEFVTHDKVKHNITVSFGVASLNNSKPETEFELIELVDHALYQSKRNGRNRVTLSSELNS